jgi:hypothetical protein
MKTTLIDYTNKKWFWTHLKNEDEVNIVCDYLRDNDLKIEIIGDGSGGWQGHGISYMLEGINLSGNGFCFSGSNLLFHCKFYRKLKGISQTEDFEEWMHKYRYYNMVRQYIIDKDQRWINEERIKKYIKT